MPFHLPQMITHETALQLESEGLLNLPALALVDCSALESFDSSVLTVLLSWQQKLQASQKQMSVQNAPEKLKVLASVYGVSPLLGL